MTYNHTYRDHQVCEIDRDYVKCKPNHSKPQNILLECGGATGSRIFTSANDTPFQIAQVNVDMNCLYRPNVLIKFSSIVRTEFLGFFGIVVLRYELFRVSDNNQISSLGIWMFENALVSLPIDNEEESFNFIFCDCINCQGCYDYFVLVTPIEINGATVTINNGRIAALTQSACKFSKDEYKTINQKDIDQIVISPNFNSNRVVLACGQGNGSVDFDRTADISDLILPTELPVEIAHVSIDTTLLNKPKVLIEVSNIVRFDSLTTNARLKFELFRVCNDGEPLSLGTWFFEGFISAFSVAGLNKAFSFTYCDCLSFSGSCQYFVTVVPIRISSSVAVVTVNNTRISALAQSSKNDNCFDNSKTLDRKCSCLDCESNLPNSKAILLECGVGSGSRTFTVPTNEKFQLANVTIDTTFLCKPKINIEFSSTVSLFGGVGILVQLRYELFRVCGNERPISLGIWSFQRLRGVDERETETFDFIFCDSLVCSECCEYFVTVTPILILRNEETGMPSGQVTVGNGRMAALAQELY